MWPYISQIQVSKRESLANDLTGLEPLNTGEFHSFTHTLTWWRLFSRAALSSARLHFATFGTLHHLKALPGLCNRWSWSTAEWRPCRNRTGSHLCFPHWDGRLQARSWSKTGRRRSSATRHQGSETQGNQPVRSCQMRASLFGHLAAAHAAAVAAFTSSLVTVIAVPCNTAGGKTVIVSEHRDTF